MRNEYRLFLSDILLEVHTCQPLEAEASLAAFLVPREARVRIPVSVSWEFEKAPRLCTEPVGTDAIQTFYRQDGQHICALRGGPKGYVGMTVCDERYQEFSCYINEAPFLQVPRTLGFVMRMLPMRTILQRHGVTFFHASQIALGDTGILFTAPSGTGKTTQARLWQRCRGVRIVCNDRVLVKNGHTWGFPLDGSEPVCSAEENRLGAIVAVRQSPQCSIMRLRPSRALQRLIPQTVIDGWDQDARQLAAEQLIRLIERVPVYDLACTMQEDTVECLEKKLEEDGVI